MPRLRFLLATLLFLPCVALAQELRITPTLDMSVAQATARKEATQSSDTAIAGRGSKLHLTYSAGRPLEMDIAPRRRQTGFDPSEMLHLTLPPGDHLSAAIDLTLTPAWSPFTQTYSLTFFSPDDEQNAEVHEMYFLAPSIGEMLSAAQHHLLLREEYQVSSFHALRGYNVLGFPLVLPVGLLTLLAMLLVLAVRRSGAAAMATLCCGTLLYAGWFGVDLLRFSIGNAREYITQGTYSKAGSAEGMAAAIRKEAAQSSTPLFVYVCHDSTDFYTKLLRYFLYPIPVSMKEEDIGRATHIVVEQKLDWSYKGGVLTCGNVTGKALKIAAFPDEAFLFSSAR